MKRSGLTLVEMLIVLVLGFITLSAVTETLLVQERGYRQLGAMVTTQQTTRGALATLAAELREVSARGGDLVLATPDSVTLRAYRRLGFVCNPDAPGKRMDVWQLGEPFAVGDSITVFADGDTLSSADDTWRFMKIAAVEAVACDVTWPGATPRRLRVTSLDSVKVYAVRRGAMGRGFTRLTYGHYQIDGQWVLGRHGPGEAPVALLGPLASPAEGGLAFAFYDAAGAQISPGDAAGRASVVRLEIKVRGAIPGASLLDGEAYVDSLVTQLYLRNN
ncbi:MAG: hypothetical protein HY703_02660 [Gemmatimonadetes bacterium]|nr:hypothetical protein [Gemmatimonadota bacterium]